MIRISTDSSVAKSFTSTRGLGKLRHLNVKLLWLQDQVHSGRIQVLKVPGVSNVADALTKPQTAAKLQELAAPHGVVPRIAREVRAAHG